MIRSRGGLSITCAIAIFCSLSLCSSLKAQTRSFAGEIRFIQYLIDKEEYREAAFLLDKFNLASLSQAQLDTVNFLKGWSAYTNKNLDTAANHLLSVSPSFPLFLKSRFFGAYAETFSGRRDTAKSILRSLNAPDSVTQEMKSFQLAGIALLNRDFKEYGVLKKDFSHSLFALEKEEERFDQYYQKLSTYRHKSPVLAGVYSALLPGAGKFYAGKKKQGIAAFLPILSLGVVTYECYKKAGLKNAKTITFGTIFSVFYIGNIWGSVLSVKIKDKEFYREYDNKILFDLHIPLRNLYN